MTEVSLEQVREAADRIHGFVRKTPLLAGPSVGGTTSWLKAESLQVTGSFKVRGVFNAVSQLPNEVLAQGLITLSAGNHGLALAHACREFGARCIVVVPDDAPRIKLEAIARYNAELVLCPRPTLAARLEQEQQARGAYLLHPFDDPAVVAGQGTVGLEILSDLPNCRRIVVPVGGGGLIAGIASAVKRLRPQVELIGVEPEGAAVVGQSLAAGRGLAAERLDTIADGLAAPYTRPLNLSIIQKLVDRMITVTDFDLVVALRCLALENKLVVEPAGAAGVAALMSGRLGPDLGDGTVAVVSGGNVDPARLAGWLTEAP